MKFRSTLPEPYSEKALRKMLSWTAKEIGYPIRQLLRIDFLRTASSWSGRCYCRQRRITIRINQRYCALEYSTPVKRERFGIEMVFHGAWDALVMIVAHELAHAADWRECGKVNERSAEMRSNRVLLEFQARRAELVAAWSREPQKAATAKAKPSLRELRLQQALRNLERRERQAWRNLESWERKARLAANKVKAWRKKVNYYERVAAVSAARKA